MHERNPFLKQPCFYTLAQHQPQLEHHLIQVRPDYHTINFKDPEALNCLTKSLAKEYLNISFDIPTNRLIPTLPLRINYLLWIQDLLAGQGRSENVRGIDIGTGASAVYAVLGAKLFSWQFIATDVDKVCVDYATRNVKVNKLKKRIKIVHVEEKGSKLTHCVDQIRRHDFCMCNPPFFDSGDNMEGMARTNHRTQPKSICTATIGEVIAEGGEEQFVGDIVNESVLLKDKVLWYTSMLGKKSSVEFILSKLSELKITKIAVTEFKQGNTTRWGVGWSLSPSVPALTPPSPRKLSTSYEIRVQMECNDVVRLVQATLEKLEVAMSPCPALLNTKSDSTAHLMWCSAQRNTWKNSRRKRREGGQDKSAEEQAPKRQKVPPSQLSDVSPSLQYTSPTSSNSSLPLLFHSLLSITSEDNETSDNETSDNETSARLSWVYGYDKDSLNQLAEYLRKVLTEGSSAASADR